MVARGREVAIISPLQRFHISGGARFLIIFILVTGPVLFPSFAGVFSPLVGIPTLHMLDNVDAFASRPPGDVTKAEIPGEAGGNQGKLTLREAIRLALANNAGFLQAKEGLDMALSRLREVEGRFRPVVGLDASLKKVGFVGSEGLFAGDDKQVVLTFNQTFPTGRYLGNPPVDLEIAHLDVRKAERELQKSREGLIYSVLSAYVGLLKAEGTVRLAESYLEQRRGSLADVELKAKLGNATRAEVLEAKQEVTDAEIGLSKARDKLFLAVARFNQVLGRRLDALVSLEDPFAEVGAMRQGGEAPNNGKGGDVLPGEPALDELISYALDNRPEIKQAEDDLLKGGLSLKKAIDPVKFPDPARPVVTFQAGYNSKDWSTGLSLSSLDRNVAWQARVACQSPSGTGFSGDGSFSGVDNWYVGLDFTWTLSDGGMARERRLQDEINIGQLKRAISSQREAVTLEVQEAYFGLAEAYDKVRSARMGLERAEEDLRVTLLRREAGTATDRNVKDAELLKLQAQSDLNSAIYDYVLARAALWRSVARPLDVNHPLLK